MKIILFTLLIACPLFASDLSSPRLKAGDNVPDVRVRTIEGKEIALSDALARKPSVVIFYRGGWCPFCTRHLSALSEIRPDLEKNNIQLVAISIDQPEKLRETLGQHNLDYTLLCDSDAAAAKAFGIAFRVDDATVKLYKDSYKIDLDAASGLTHHLLPHPAVYVIATDGKIHFAHVNEDYKQRLPAAEILQAAKAAQKK